MVKMASTLATAATLAGTLAMSAANAVDKFYKGDVDLAWTQIQWGMQTAPRTDREKLYIDPPWERSADREAKVEVLALIGYGWYHGWRQKMPKWGRNAHVLFERWVDSLPESVTVVRIPIAFPKEISSTMRFAERERVHRSAILTGRLLGIEDRVDDAIFAAMKDAKYAVENEGEVRELFAGLGVEPQRFETAWNSNERKLAERDSEKRQYRFFRIATANGFRDKTYETPMLIINGEHIVSAMHNRDARRAYQIANWHIANELAPEPERSEEDQRWRAMYEEIRRARSEHVAWGKELKPELGQVIEIDPPMSTDSGDRVEVEWFFNYINRGHDARRTTAYMTNVAMRRFRRLYEGMPENERERIRVKMTVVAGIEGHSQRHLEHEQVHQRIAHGWAYDPERGISMPLNAALSDQFAWYAPVLGLTERGAAREMLKKKRLPFGRYRRVAATDVPAKRAEAANARLREVTRRAGEAALVAPRHPIVLVDGRYLVQGSTAGGYVNAVRIVNWLVARELERSSG